MADIGMCDVFKFSFFSWQIGWCAIFSTHTDSIRIVRQHLDFKFYMVYTNQQNPISPVYMWQATIFFNPSMSCLVWFICSDACCYLKHFTDPEFSGKYSLDSLLRNNCLYRLGMCFASNFNYLHNSNARIAFNPHSFSPFFESLPSFVMFCAICKGRHRINKASISNMKKSKCLFCFHLSSYFVHRPTYQHHTECSHMAALLARIESAVWWWIIRQ